MSYSNQANRLMGLVKNLENRYNKNEILYNDAINLIKKYHGEIDQLASNAKVKHANKRLAQLNLAVVKQNGSVDFPVRVWNKYLNAAEKAVQNAINDPTPKNIAVAEKKINNVKNNQNKIQNIVTLPNNKPNNKPMGCDRYGFGALPNRSSIMKSFRNLARSNHSNKGGAGMLNMNDLIKCRDEAIAKLPVVPNKPKNNVPMVPNKPKNIRPNTKSIKRRLNMINKQSPLNKFRGLVNRAKAQQPAVGNKFRGLVNRAKAQQPLSAPKPAMSFANQLKAKRNGLKKTGNMASNRFRKNMMARKPMMAPKPMVAPKPRAAPSMASQLAARKMALKPTGARAAPKFRQNMGRGGASKFRGAVRATQATRRFR